MNTITLQNGIVITDKRHLGSGCIVENDTSKYFALGYSGRDGYHFYIINKFQYVVSDVIEEYAKDFESMKNAMNEANQWILNKEVIK